MLFLSAFEASIFRTILLLLFQLDTIMAYHQTAIFYTFWLYSRYIRNRTWNTHRLCEWIQSKHIATVYLVFPCFNSSKLQENIGSAIYTQRYSYLMYLLFSKIRRFLELGMKWKCTRNVTKHMPQNRRENKCNNHLQNCRSCSLHNEVCEIRNSLFLAITCWWHVRISI